MAATILSHLILSDLFLMSIYVDVCLCLHVYAMCMGAQGGQKRMLDSPEAAASFS